MQHPMNGATKNATIATPAPPAATDPLVRRSTIAVVIAVAVGAAFVSYRHAYELVHSHGETGAAALIGPGTVDGLIYASGMVLLAAARRRQRAPRLAYLGLALGIVATIGANVAHGLGHGPIGALVSAWPALALIISYELLLKLIRTGRDAMPEGLPGPAVATERRCPHGVAETAQEAAVTAFLHGRDCLGEEPSQRHLSAAFAVDRKKLAQWLREVAQPEPQDADDQVPAHALNGHAPAGVAP